MIPTLGVCYYPEHWPEEQWAEDARRMVEAGLTWVRVGEFAWSRIEPRPGQFDWDWLDRAVETLGAAGLKVVMGTPTATPPRWMIERHSDMLAVDELGHIRTFGSRRHYCFSHEGYRAEARRIATLFGERYGRNPHVEAWQIDNEYGCHETTLSYSDAARDGFRDWLAQKYQSPDALNRAWGNVFWSMEYHSFDEIELPNLTVTEPNPAHVMAFHRYSSEQVVLFNRVQAEALRALTDAPLIHNYMGRELSFDHFDVGADLDIASWDSYPIGFLSDRLEADQADKTRYLRQGDPDNQAFHHDLYRAVGRGRWWIMEQQPGPVNWAPWNTAPLPGMMRLWAWEAIAHGAEAVLYFRWRQAPFAQEQFHAGLLYPDSNEAPGLGEAATVAAEIEAMGAVESVQAPVALLFDYQASWAIETQPQGQDSSYFMIVLDAYRALRRAGLSVDVLPVDADLDGYKLILAPGLAIMDDALKARLKDAKANVVVGPRAAAKTEEVSVPLPLPPNLPGLDVVAPWVESLPPGVSETLEGGGFITRWFEHLKGDAPVRVALTDGRPVLMGTPDLSYLGGWPDRDGWNRILARVAEDAGLALQNLPAGLRLRDTKTLTFAVNYAPEDVEWKGQTIPAAGVAWWPRES